MTRPYPMAEMPFEQEYKQEIAHIYDLLRNICTFKKVRFAESDDWSQSSDGYYKLIVPCTDFVALAAFENIDGASDKRANCVADINKKFVTITSTYPFNGYLVAADVNIDDDDTTVKQTSDITVDRELSKNSLNPVTNRAVTLAINSLMKQVSQTIDIPASLPASDVYAWAKTKNKPCYSWDEICGKPNLISEVTYKGKKLKIIGNTLILDKLADVMEIPTKLSQLELDASVFDLADGEELRTTLSTLIDNDDKLESLVQSQAKDLENAINELQANDDDLERSLDNLNSRVGVIKNTVTQNYLALENEIAASEARCNKAREDHVKEVETTIAKLAKASKDEDDILHAQLSALAHECRLHHDMYDAQFASVAADLAKLQASSAEALVELIKSEIASTEKDIAELEGRVDDLEDAQITVKASEINGNIVVNNKEVVVYDDKALQKNVQDVIDDVDNVVDRIDEVAEKVGSKKDGDQPATGIYAKLDEIDNAIDNIVDSEEFTKVADGVEKNAEDIEALAQKLNSLSESASIKIDESSINGNIVVSYPVDVTESGAVIYGNTQELVIYTESEALKKLEEEAVERLAANDNVIPSKVSELENDLNYITRKQAAGLVASATVNFDTAFQDDDPANITYVKTVNISDSQGSVIVNGDDIVVNVDGIGEMQTAIAKNATDIAEIKAELENISATEPEQIIVLQNNITELQTTINTQETTINNMSQEITELTEKLAALENLFKTFVDEDGVLSDNEQPLWEKQDQATAVTDSDAMDVEDITKLYNEAE